MQQLCDNLKLNRNKLKIIACLSMLLDHVGVFIFPGVTALRWAGRLAFPLFAFFIGEGSVYTRNRKKYFLQVFLLGVGCQLVYLAEELIFTRRISVYSDFLFFNILLTFSLAIPACCLLKDAIRERKPKKTAVFLLYFSGVSALILGFWFLRKKYGMAFYFDYGFSGILLPVSAVLFSKKELKLISFGIATLIYCMVLCRTMPYVWCSLAVIPLLVLYNGDAGSKKLKYMFYIFYPAHLGLIYLISMLIYSR